MRRLSKLALVVCASFSSSVLANSIQGIIKSEDGQAIANASIQVHGTDIETQSDANGNFIFQNLATGDVEIHVVANGFAHLHKDLDLSASGISNLSLALKRSPIEVVDIVSTPFHLSAMESSMPINVLTGETLRRQQKSTLGDTLEKLAGVHTSFHGKVASTPVIRGLSGPRVLIAQNGLDVSDVSRVGPDHAVAGEASTATQIEVLRGPASLFYGSGAVGGVVNIVDNRVPRTNETSGEWLVEKSTVDNQDLASFNFTSGFDSFAVYADGFYRKSDDYEIPGMAELEHDDDHGHEDEHGHEDDEHSKSGKNTVENSAEESYGFTLGGSMLFDNGFLGFSAERLDKEYGIPGHSHGDEGHEDEHDDEHDDEQEEEHSDEVFADLEQTKIQMLGEFSFDNKLIREIHLKAGYTDYQHSEIEGGEIGTTFENNTFEVRVDALHKDFNGWRGGLSLHYKDSDVSALGEEAFTPPSNTEMLALALIEERHVGDVLFQLGARIEHVSLDAPEVLLPHIDAHSHDDEHEGEEEHGEDEHDDEHGDEHGEEETLVFASNNSFTPITLSAGAVWDFMPSYNVGISVSRSERAPSASELFSFGPHIGTRTFEVGALFTLDQTEEDAEFEVNTQDIELETANNIDITFRKTEGDVGFIFNAFYNSVNNYYYQTNTGLFGESGHDHDHEEEHEESEMSEAFGHDDDDGHDDGHDEGHEGESEGELPIFLFRTDDVILHGFEAQVAWQVTSEFKASAFSDFVRARLKNGGDLPRTPPLRFGTQFAYETTRMTAHLDITRFQSQDRVADFETTTDGYTLVDASVSYDLDISDMDITVYLKGNNLTNAEARVHTSFLKDLAPRPGRNLSLGIRGNF